jgi:hypothetical protein
MKTMKQIFACSMVITLMLCMLGCSKNEIASVLDDISRDTYENNLRKQRNENKGKPNYEEPLTYGQYQRERKKLIQDNQATIPNVKQK